MLVRLGAFEAVASVAELFRSLQTGLVLAFESLVAAVLATDSAY